VQLAQFVVARGELEVRAGEQRTLVATTLRELLPADALAMPRGRTGHDRGGQQTSDRKCRACTIAW